MKQKLPGGTHELELLTADEVTGIVNKALAVLKREAEVVRAPALTVQLDGYGNGAAVVYRVKQGCDFVLTRWLLEADGFSPSVPYATTAAAQSWEFRRNQADGPLVAFDHVLALPFEDGDGIHEAARLFGGEVLWLVIVGGPTEGTVQAEIQGFLYKTHEPSEIA